MNPKNQKYFITAICLILLIIPISLPFCLYGQDGYHLWYPIIAEYLRGDVVYHSSAVIFDGQNLAALYGELPFWKLLRLMGLPVHTFLNATHALWMITFFLTLLPIVPGFRNSSLKSADLVFIAAVVALSPIVVNRILAGHLNLLYGMLPFFAAVSLIFNKRWYNILLLIFAIWCALSTQAYQLLAYHCFYLPLLGYLIYNYERDLRRYLLFGSVVVITAFIINYPLFSEMLQFALDPNSSRNLGNNIVYSYLVTTYLDFPHLLINTPIAALQLRPLSFYHEINYAAGAFLILLVTHGEDKPFKLIFGITLLILLGFSMNLPLFNLISELPLIKAFRVPQRALMVPMLLLPLYCYSKMSEHVRTYEIVTFIFLVIFSQLFNYADVFWLLIIMILIVIERDPRFVHKKELVSKAILIAAMASIFPASFNKLKPGYYKQQEFIRITQQLEPLHKMYDPQTRRKRVFHFDHETPALYTYVAQTLGYRTMEGYGHPPKEFLEVFTSVTGKNVLSNNQLYFSAQPNKEELMKAFYVETIVQIDQHGKISIQEILPQ